MNTVFKALSDPTRRTVLQLLQAGPLGAGELAAHFEVSKPTMSAHFAVLAEAGLIEADKQGRSIVYRLKMSVLEEALLGFAAVFGLQVQRTAVPVRSPAAPPPPPALTPREKP
jgi:DNA-binding transcriptional ArsR family regulator